MKVFLTILLLPIFSGALAQDSKIVYNDPDFVKQVLGQQNAYRTSLNLQPMTWSPKLAEDALAWAKVLARSDKGRHDPNDRKLHEGENIWWGTASAFSYIQMVDFWASEKQHFVFGIYPNCTDSASAVIGHYTQMIWRNTIETGCALVSNGKIDFLVCRYSPPGNVIGQKPY